MDICLVKTAAPQTFTIFKYNGSGWVPLPEFKHSLPFYPHDITHMPLPTELVRQILINTFLILLREEKIEQAGMLLQVNKFMVTWFHRTYICHRQMYTFADTISMVSRTLQLAFTLTVGANQRQRYLGNVSYQYREGEGEEIWWPYEISSLNRGFVPNPRSGSHLDVVSRQVVTGPRERDLCWVRSQFPQSDYVIHQAHIAHPFFVLAAVKGNFESDADEEGAIYLPVFFTKFMHMQDKSRILPYFADAPQGWVKFRELLQEIFGPRTCLFFQEHEVTLGTSFTDLHKV